MKNVHLLPTDKPSRLYKTSNFLLLDSKAMPNNTLETKNQNIYITSDDEIKMDDWYLDDTNSVRQAITECESYWTHRKKYQKIILTTDPELIANGVQAIDDEFLEWFVKNPSCERVEVVKGKMQLNDDGQEYGFPDMSLYKIILPQEEPKQETLEDSIYQAIGLAANEQGIINQALATSKVMDVLKKTNL
jgi:hypothetical protein